MSIAVAVKKRGKTVVAADTQETFGSRRMLGDGHRPTKVVRVGSSYLAQTGWGVYANVFADYLPRSSSRLRTEKEVFSFFQRFWKALHEKYSFVDDQSDASSKSPFADLDSSFMVVNRSGIFLVSASMSVTAFESYYAIGSGSSYALGALHVLYGQNLSAEEVARRACEAAMAYDIYCGGQVDFYSV